MGQDTTSRTATGASLTDWSMVLDSGRMASPTRRDSLEQLVRRYWPVLYAGAKATGLSADDANDAVQGFVADILLERNLPGQATPDRGRFRGLLSRSFRNYLVDRARAANSQKRRPSGRLDSLQHESAVDPPTTGDSDPEMVFARHWVATVLRTTIDEVRTLLLESDRAVEWRILDARLVRPLVDGAEPVPYSALVEDFWRVKKGSKGQTAWERLMRNLLYFLEKYGEAVLKDQLELAINGKWNGIEPARYEQFKAAGKPPEAKHPAAQVFTAKDFDNGPSNNPALGNLF